MVTVGIAALLCLYSPTDSHAIHPGGFKSLLTVPVAVRDADRYTCRRPRHVSLIPVCPARLLDHLIRLEEERRRDGQAKGLRGLEVDRQLKLAGPLHRQVGGLR